MCAWSNSHVQLFVTPWTVARQALLSLAFSRQEYWSGLPCPPPGESSYPRIEPSLPHCRQILCLMKRQGSFTDTIFYLKGWHGFSVLNILVMFSQKQLKGDYCHKEHYWWNFFLKPRIIWALKQKLRFWKTCICHCDHDSVPVFTDFHDETEWYCWIQMFKKSA